MAVERSNAVFGRRLTECLGAQRGRRAELATFLKVGRSAVSKFCSGRVPDDWETLTKIARFCRKSVDYMLGNSNDPAPPGREKATQQSGVLENSRIPTPEELQAVIDAASAALAAKHKLSLERAARLVRHLEALAADIAKDEVDK